MQKKDKKNNTTTQMALGDITLCPVPAAAAIVRRIRSYLGANNDTPISAIWKYDRIKHIMSKQITNTLRDAVSAIGEDIAKNEIGTHSIFSGAAMAMFLGGCRVFLIKMIGRWSSAALLRYIRKQVKEFNHDVSHKMLTHMFHRHIPNYSSQTVSHLDPRQCNHPDNTKTRNNVGGVPLGKPGFLSSHNFIEHYGRMSGNTLHLLYHSGPLHHTQILGSTKLEEASLLVPTELGRRGFESLLEHNSKTQLPLCIC
jgi:hypothetical protein